MAQSITVAASTQKTVAATAATMALNPVPKSTTVMLTAVNSGGSSNALFTVEYSLDDVSALGAPTATFALLSSGAALESSSIASGGGLSWTVLSPIAGLRLSSTSGSSGSNVVFTLKALQSVTA